MATMKIPEDEEQRNIIDKLANFVARNGPKFEDLTKSKQKDNPKFSFLFGGDYHEYYKWKVSLETTQVEAQKRQQEASLTVLSVQNQPSSQSTEKGKEANKPKDPDYIDLVQFRELVQKLILACTKDNIQNGKNWIVTHAQSESQLKKVAKFLFRRLLEEVLPFQQKLHIVYLANDVLHHSRKRELPKLQEALQTFILPLIGVVFNGESPENQQKVAKVLKIWENQCFFTEDVRAKLKDPSPLYDQYLGMIDAEKAEMKKEKDEKEEKLRKVKEEKENPVKLPDPSQPPPQGAVVQQPPPPMQPPQDPANFLYQQQQPPPQAFQPPPPQAPPQVTPPVPPPQVSSSGPPQTQYQQFQQFGQWNPQQPPPQQQTPSAQPDPFHYFNQNFSQRPQQTFDQRPRFPPYQQGFPPGARPPLHGDPGYEQPPPSGPDWNQSYDMPPQSTYQSAPPSIQTFDYSHQSVPPAGAPPAGAAPISIDYEHGRAPVPEAPFVEERDPTIPLAHYYDLPAGLIVPLVKLWDCEYKPVDPKDIRLPIPQPPSERLLAAVEAFYAPPSHDRPRDSQGWEKNGLFEFYKAKIKYIKDKERKIENIERSPSPIESGTSEEEGSPLVTTKPRHGRSSSRSPVRQRSKSRSPSRDRKRSLSKSRSRSRSRSRSTSRSPRRRGSRSRSRSYSRSKSRSPRKEPIQRSPTPPAEFVMFETKSMDSRIEESNVGHKMLMKMGWGGQGLGKQGTGIVDPIKQDQVRDKQDKFKGIGIDIDDPFESYRKNKSYTYSRPRERRK